MNSAKPWWQSKAVWGGVVAVAAGAAGVFGLNLDPLTQISMVEYLTEGAAAVGGLLAIYGRVTADKQIGPKE